MYYKLATFIKIIFFLNKTYTHYYECGVLQYIVANGNKRCGQMYFSNVKWSVRQLKD